MGQFDRIFSLTFLLFCSFLFGCQNQAARAKKLELNAHSVIPLPELVMENADIEFYGEKGLEWELISPKTQSFTLKKKIIASPLTVHIFKDGRPSTKVDADRGQLNTATEPTVIQKIPGFSKDLSLLPGDMFLSGNVVVVSTDGNKMKTDWLHYKKSLDLIVSTAPVELIRSDSITHGIGLESTADMNRVKIFNQTVIIKDSDGK